MIKFIDEFEKQVVHIILSINEVFDKLKRENMIFVNVQRDNERDELLLFEIYSKLIEDREDVQFENVFAFNHFN